MSLNGNVELALLEPVLEGYRGADRSKLLPVLHDVQRIYGYLPEPALEAVSRTLRVPLADIHGVVEFYSLFYGEPVGRRIIRICTDPSCMINGAEDSLAAACKHAGGIQPGETSADGRVTVERSSCLGLCDQAPAALVDDMAVVGVTPERAGHLLTIAESNAELRVTGQPRVLTRNIGALHPTDLPRHRASGTFRGLELAITRMTPEQIIDVIDQSKLVGRGGAAFPTGLKWKFTRNATGSPKYVVVNADESEPGTFKDRVLMEGDPYHILEGMAICGYAIGAQKGYIYIRGEYAKARAVMQEAINKCYKAGLLGEHIMGTDFNFDVEIRVGAGAYICGEETALFEAIEGKRGFPRIKPPFPTNVGLFGKPTVINNVETLAKVADILLNGPDWFRHWGTDESAGYKLFCVSGHVNQPGVVEAPFGITINELVERWCGGFKGAPQAVLMGGAAGVFLTPEHFYTPLFYENLRPLGASIGSGAIMVFNKSVDMNKVLEHIAYFFAHESCGKCYPCQMGTQRQLELLRRAAEGRAEPGDLERLMDIGRTMTDASICGLGQTAGMAVMSALRRWPELVQPVEKGSEDTSDGGA